MAKVCVIGSWHQAMVVSACFSDLGHRVYGVCDSATTAKALNEARPVVYEPGLATVMRRCLRRGTLQYGTDYRQGLLGARFVFICIDTPVGANDESQLDTIVEAARQIGRNKSGDVILCVSAQVPVGTTEQLRDVVVAERTPGECEVAYIPEFLRLGSALKSFRRADRFVIGVERPQVATRIKKLYRALKRPVIVTDIRTAEMAKHASNAFLAVSISFINEIGDLAERIGADTLAVAQILKSDRRIGPAAFLSPGLGFAGGTLGRELQALKGIARREQCETRLIDAAMQVNSERAAKTINKIERMLGSLVGRRIGVLGLTYKPGTSTMRRAISLEIIRMLSDRGASVAAFDSLADLDGVECPTFDRLPTPHDVAIGSDALVLVTEWHGVAEIDWNAIQKVMRRPLIVDTRNVFDPIRMQRLGFEYAGIGRPMAHAAGREP